MDRTAQRNFLKTASTVAIDILARARFLEGVAGVTEGHLVRNQSPGQLASSVIPQLTAMISADARERTGEEPTPAGMEALGFWASPQNSRMYDRALQMVTNLFDEDTAGDTLARALYAEPGGHSSLWETGRMLGRNPTFLRQFISGNFQPIDALKVALRALKRDALDLVRVKTRRQELMEETGNAAVTEDIEGLTADEWSMVIDRLTAEPHSPVAQEFWDWLIGQAQQASTPAVVALFESIADGRERSQEDIAREFGITPGGVSKAKGEFVNYITGVLAAGKADRYPEVMNVLSDASFLHDLYRGRVRGDRVARRDPKSAGPGIGLGGGTAESIRKILKKYPITDPAWEAECNQLARAFTRAALLPIDQRAEYVESMNLFLRF